MTAGVPGCELCEAARLTDWFHEDDTCWVADCEICGVPMVVWKRHGKEPPDDQLEHMLAAPHRGGRRASRYRGMVGRPGDAPDPGSLPRARSRPQLVVPPLRPTVNRLRTRPVIKYLGSKRRLVPALCVLAEASRARTALDLFAGTTRVAQAWKQIGLAVTAVDAARCSHVLARCYIEADPAAGPQLTRRGDLRDRPAQRAARVVPGT